MKIRADAAGGPIRIFVIDGDPENISLVDRVNWIGVGVGRGMWDDGRGQHLRCKMAASKRGLALWKFSVGMAAKLSGGMAGVGTTAMTTNPFWGAAVGVSLAHTLERVGTEVVERRLAPRQNARVGRAIVIACSKLKEHQMRGMQPRDDGFFDPGHDGRSAADEVTEATLQAAMNSAQEQKVDFIGALLANISVKRDIDVPTTHLLIELASSLSYRAFALMRIAGNIDTFGFGTRIRAGEGLSEAPPDFHPLMVEIYELSRRGVIVQKDSAASTDSYATLDCSDVDPSKMRLSTVGQLLHDNLELANLDASAAVYARTVDQLRKLSHCGKGTSVLDGGTY